MTWDTLKKAEDYVKSLEENTKVNKQYCALVASVFGTEDGKKLLDTWKDMLVMNSYLNFGLPPEHLFVAEGKNEWVRHVIKSIMLHEEEIAKKL